MIRIDMDNAGHIWRYEDGIPTVELYESTPEDATILGLVRYGDGYPGERWEVGEGVTPAQVLCLYYMPPVASRDLIEEFLPEMDDPLKPGEGA